MYKLDSSGYQFPILSQMAKLSKNGQDGPK